MMKNPSFTEAVRCKIYNEIELNFTKNISVIFTFKKMGKARGGGGWEKGHEQF
jgi:hypothetical protein